MVRVEEVFAKKSVVIRPDTEVRAYFRHCLKDSTYFKKLYLEATKCYLWPELSKYLCLKSENPTRLLMNDDFICLQFSLNCSQLVLLML